MSKGANNNKSGGSWGASASGDGWGASARGDKSNREGRSCYSTYTSILMDSGEQEFSGHLKVGDIVKSMDSNRKLFDCEVKSIITGFSVLYNIAFGHDQKVMRATADHKFLTLDGVKRVDQLDVECDLLGVLQPDEKLIWTSISEITICEELEDVINIRLYGGSTVIVEGLIGYNYSHFRQLREFLNNFLYTSME